MLTQSNLTLALQERIKESVRLKKERDTAKTSTKRKYIQKKLVKNNLIASKMLAALEKIQSQGKTNAEPDISDGHSEKES